MVKGENPAVSVIVPMHDVAQYLPDFLTSMARQSYGDYEIVAWDDGSGDDTAAICERAAAEDSRIRLFRAENQGVAGVRRSALAKARGTFITFADPDDLLDATYLERLVRALTEHGADMAVCRAQNFEDGDEPSLSVQDSMSEEVIGRREAASRLCDRFFVDDDHAVRPELWGKMFTRATMESMTIPQLRTCSDYPAVTDAICASNRIAVVHAPLYWYRMARAGSLQTKVSQGKLNDIWTVHEYAIGACRDLAHVEPVHLYRETVGTVFYINEKIMASAGTMPLEEVRANYRRYRAQLRAAGVHRGLNPKGYLKLMLYRGAFAPARWAFEHLG